MVDSFCKTVSRGAPGCKNGRLYGKMQGKDHRKVAGTWAGGRRPPAQRREKVEIAAGIVSPALHVPGWIIWEILPDPDLYSLEYYLRLKRGINRYKSLLIRINISINTLLHNQRVCRCAEAGRNNNKQKGNFTQIHYKQHTNRLSAINSVLT